MNKWTIVEALALINKEWLECEYAGYHLALTGSVLCRGWSDNDLDLVIYPRGGVEWGLHTDYRPTIEILRAALKAAPPRVVERPDEKDYKLVITLTLPDKRRVEVFVPNFAHEGRLDTWQLVPASGTSMEEKVAAELAGGAK